MSRTNNKSALLVVFLLFLLRPFAGLTQSSVPFTFSLSTGARTSAGVFKKDGTLIRTLWSGVTYSGGSHSSSWDGTDDAGMLVTDSNYDIRVLSNNVNYSWEGVVGNSSAQKSGTTVMHSFQNMFAMAISGSTIYYATNYGERVNATFKTSTSSPDSKISLADQGGSINLVTTDGNYVYWAGYDPFSGNNVVAYIPSDVNNKTYVYATKVSDDQQVNFSSGTKLNLTYLSTPMNSCIDIGGANALISGIAVQNNGIYLFVAHQKLNRLDVLNKTTGALVRSITITSPGSLSTDGLGNLWMVSGSNTVAKYAVNADGSLTAPKLSLASLVAPLAIAVSPDNNTVIVADGGNSQQVKAFNTSSGAASWTYGQAGGYASDATVTNDKFFFTDIDRSNRSFVCFASDGSFWVGDPGDNRSLHFASDRTYIEQIVITPHFYGCTVDPNDPTRAFAEYLEYKIDYSKSLDPKNGSWTLVKNWKTNITPAYDDMTRFFKVATLSNGRTYGLVHHSNYKWAVVEFPKSGNLRFTGIETQDLSYSLNADGSLASGLIMNNGSLTPYINKPLNGFDGSNNPIWGAATVVVPAPPFSASDPQGDYATVTSSNIVVAFDDHLNNGFHLAGIKPGTNKWLWRTAPSTTTNYTGPYLNDGSYDIGNGVVYGGSIVLPMDRSVIWGYHGEFWKNSQTNKWNQVYDDGLFVGQFGVTGPEVSGTEAAASMAGNALSAGLVKDASGNWYLYHCDEFNHSGLHRWKITGLNTIQEQTIPVVFADSSHGLLGEYMDGSDLNNLNTKSTRVDKTVNFSWGSAIPTGTQITSASNFSVRWSGYVKPAFNENYIFTINTSNKIRLWVNNSLLLDQWTNNSQKSLTSSTINLKAGALYTIVLEYGNSSAVGGGTESLSWSSTSQALQVIPSNNLFPSPMPDTANGLDLMSGLQFRQTLQNNIYGWGRTPVQEDISNAKYTKWWSVQSGFNSVYSPTGSPDVSASFTQPSSTYSVTRDLGSYASNLNSWKLSGTINFLASNFNFGTGGMYLEVLDVAGKVITRFQVTSAFGASPILSVKANLTDIVKGDPSVMNTVVYQNQPIAITYGNGKATYQYGNYSPISIPVVDATGNGLKPKTMRLYFFQNGGPYYNREVDLVSMRFSPNGAVIQRVNQPPVAVTGAAKTVTLPGTVTLDGSASFDPDGKIVGYNWILASGSGGTISTPTGSTTTVTGLTAGTYIYKLTVTDDSSATAFALDTITIKAAANLPPIANAGADQTITLPKNSVSVDGSASKDQDNGGLISNWSWNQSSGPSGATITSPTTAASTITGLQTGVYVFKLVVTDAAGATAYDSVIVTVKAAANIPPVADAGASKTITLPVNTITLDGSLSKDTDGTISTYSWAQVSGPSTASLVNANQAKATANNLLVGQYIFELTVTDNSGATSKAQVKISVVAGSTQPPSANAGANQTIILPTNQVSLDGSSSVAPSGNIVSYIWIQSSGPSTAGLSSASSAKTNATGLIKGTYIFYLTVTDNNNAKASDSVIITVNAAANIPPVANAGTSVTITLPTNTVTIDGSASSDADGTITSYSWAQILGPSSSSLTNTNQAKATANNLIVGQYIFELTVTDNSGATSKAQVKVNVLAAASLPPIANAGANQTITLPVNQVSLDGSASDAPSGNIVSYSWTQASGPSTAGLSSATSAKTNATGLVAGTYIFYLIIKDDNNAKASDSVIITVMPAANIPPVASAPTSMTITLPINSITLDGSTSYDPDGTIVSYSWTQVSGPSTSNLINANQAIANAKSLVVGQYIFQLMVTDNSGTTSIVGAEVKVNVVAAPSQPPIANAGANQTITLPTSQVSLDGSSSVAPSGSIVSYAWTQSSGPSTAGLSAASAAQTNATGLVAGTYIFYLTITDNNNATAFDSVIVTVKPAANIPPVANPGNSVTITLPTNTVTLDGSGSSDPDGTISSYSWQQTAGPNTAVTTDTTLASLSLSGLMAGQYTYQLTVTDNRGATATASVKITVVPAPNALPVADAGPDQTITAPSSSVNLNGSNSSDADGTIASYAWTLMSGAGSITINNGNTATPSVTGLTPGIYVFQLMVTDNSGATAKAQVTITVNPKPATPNQLPIANAGNNQTITAPENSIDLNGSSSFDPDGTIAIYSWKEVSGPTTVVFTGSSTPTPTVSGLVVGTYVFELLVIDNNGGSSTDQVTVTVNPEVNKINQIPVASAGTDTTIALPSSSYELNATSSYDPDGTITSYHWQQIGGPATADASSMDNAVVDISNLQPGQYEFQVMVTDNQGATSTATVIVSVEQGTGVADQLLIYPNPAHDILNQKITSQITGTMKISIYDMNGRLVQANQTEKSSDVLTNSLNVSTLANGMYTIQVNVANRKIMVAKFMKM